MDIAWTGRLLTRPILKLIRLLLERGILKIPDIFHFALRSGPHLPNGHLKRSLDSLSCSTLILQIRNHVDSPGSALRQAKRPAKRPPLQKPETRNSTLLLLAPESQKFFPTDHQYFCRY